MAHSNFSIIGSLGNKVFGNHWSTEKEVKGNVIIVHGMGEYSYRYNEFALFLNENGYNVYALDHIGHGKNCPNKEGLGIWPRDGFERCVENVYILLQQLVKENPNTMIFAHSMGSFMTQLFIEKYPGAAKKVVLCGSGGPSPLFKAGSLVAKIVCSGKNRNKPSKFMTNMSFGSYNNKYEDVQSEFDWLSANRENVNKYLADDYCGFTQSGMFYISFTENLAKIHNKKLMKQISKEQKLLLIAGKDDPVSNYGKTLHKLNSMYVKLGIDSELILYEGLRHEILNEDQKDIVMKDVLDFLNL